jgi:ubiquitin
MSLVLKMATSYNKRRCVLELAKKESEQLCKVHFARNFTRSQQAEYPFKSGEIPFNGKGVFAKALILVGLLFLVHLWVVFGSLS